jgi:uncharacterized membrane protein
VLPLTVPLSPGQAHGLASAVLARLALAGKDVWTVVLEVQGAAELDAIGWEELCRLHDQLRRRRTRLTLVIAARQAREELLERSRRVMAGVAVHHSVRSAVLAAYSELPGPGLVTSEIRIAMTAPAEPLSLLRELLPPWHLCPCARASPAPDGARAAGRLVNWPGSVNCGRKETMADLIAIGYPDEATAELAANEARRLARDLIIEPDAIAVIVRDSEGKFHVHTSHHPVGAGATWGMFWGLLFGLLFFIPFFGLAVGAGMGALMGKITKSGIDRAFQDQVRDMLKPGTSALFLMVEKVTPDKAVEALRQHGGTVLKSSLSKDGEHDLQEALHGAPAGAAS